MRRGLLAIGILLSAAMCRQAEYIRIVYLLGASKNRGSAGCRPCFAAAARAYPGGLASVPGLVKTPGRTPAAPGKVRAAAAGAADGDPPVADPPGTPGQPPGGQNRLLDDIDDPNMLKADVVVEYSREDTEKFLRTRGFPVFPRIYHKWGRTGITKTADLTFTLIRENGLPLPPVAMRFKLKRGELLRDARQEERGGEATGLGTVGAGARSR